MLAKLAGAALAATLAATAPTCSSSPTPTPETTPMPDPAPTPTVAPLAEKTSGALDYADKTGAPNPDADLAFPEGTPRAEAVLAGGCFWCVEAVYEQLTGILDAESGYAGGSAETAKYELVSRGNTGHAEAVRIVYDPAAISYGQILKVFFTVAHDPTQKNRQGPDVGPQYRSAVFYANDQEKQVAEAYIRKLNESGHFDKPLATTLEPLEAFYPAEGYHQDYARNNPAQPYIVFQARPKVEKVREKFPDALKSGS